MASEATATGQGPQTVEALAEEVAAQSALVNELRKQGAENAAVEEAKKKLGELKKSLALLQHARGTRDYGPGEMFCREHVERIVKDTTVWVAPISSAVGAWMVPWRRTTACTVGPDTKGVRMTPER